MQQIGFLNNFINKQIHYEVKLENDFRKQEGIFFTNSNLVIENILDVIDINKDIFSKKILEPSCGQGIFLLHIIHKIYKFFPDKNLISNFISNNLYFIDIEEKMVETTKNNIRSIYKYLFNTEYNGKFNGIIADFTDKKNLKIKDFFYDKEKNIFHNLYNEFDYVIGNPPYISLYGRRDKKKNEEQRINYLKNYEQFPDTVKNGKINMVMLFLEHSLDFLKQNGKLSFIIDISFFETAYKYTRKYLLENTTINELGINIVGFEEVASGQVILKLTKNKTYDNKVKITDYKKYKTYYILQNSWNNKEDEYKFRYNGCLIFKQILEKVKLKQDKTLLQLFPNKNLRTCVMLLNMEDKFTSPNINNKNLKYIYPYYQGSKSLSEKFGKLTFSKYFYYDKNLQDKINLELKIKLEKEGIKNKKRIGLGETIIYDNPKIFIRQSAKEIIATIDFNKSAANNSLYVFTFRDNSQKSVDYLYFLCAFLNSDFVTYFAQQMNIIRFYQGKQPQIKISDLGCIPVPNDINLQKNLTEICKEIYNNNLNKYSAMKEINKIIYNYYGFTDFEKENIKQSIKDF